ncbi:MAG: methionine adenosyltransferase [Clostridia bacterium]|nr:methionine adenosyltransferase [Clostridia bacterium]
MNKRLFTSESITEGHPDKVCDSIADAILDEVLRRDKNARSACEVCATTNLVLIMGEITVSSKIDLDSIARAKIKEIGYTHEDIGFDYKNCEIMQRINRQSPDIAMGVNNSAEHKLGGRDYDLIGAGDQGMMYGYACDETEQLMPMPVTLAHALTRTLTEARKSGEIDYLRPDGKAQVTVEYENCIPKRVHTVVLSSQHAENVSQETIRADIFEKVIKKAIPEAMLDKDTLIYINPTGRFVVGGPNGDSGLTGRKIIADTYGGYCPHGGGAFSGKDPTKVDRSAAYYARYVCKNIVAAKLAKHCQLEVSYAIGRSHPISLRVNTFNTSTVDEEIIEGAVKKVFDFRPAAIIDNLDLLNPIYSASTNYGHFGKKELPWEQCDKVEAIRKAVEEWS